MTSRLYLPATFLAVICASQAAPAASPDAQALFQQAVNVQNGDGVAIDLQAAQDLLEKAAAAGSPMAMQRLGDMYHEGDSGVVKDFAKAVEWYKKEAAWDESHPGTGALGMIALGESYQHGRGVTQDQSQANDWFKKALQSAQTGAAKGDNSAMIALAYCLAEGKAIKPDAVNAWQWAVLAAQKPNPWAYEIQASLYARGVGVKQDDSKALANTLLAAQMGVAQDMLSVSLCFAGGIGVKQNETAAMEWIDKAVERGNSRAKAIKGKYYHEGIGVERSDTTAKDWFQKAIDQGDEAALGFMGDMFIGPGVNPREPQKAKEYFEMGAQKGDLFSMYKLAKLLVYEDQIPHELNTAQGLLLKSSNLGYGDSMNAMGELYRDGKFDSTPGAPQGNDAIAWFRQAAQAGSPLGMRNLGLALRTKADGLNPFSSDDDDPKMMAEAFSWTRQAAEAGEVEAMADMGEDYLNAKGVSGSPTQAAVWFRKAAEAGNVRAMRSLGKLYSENRVLADYAEARKWYEMGIERGDPASMSGLGQIYDNALGVPEDNAKALQLYQRAAELRDGGGYRGLGQFAQNAGDLKAAAAFFQTAVDLGDVPAMEALGRMYELGQGVEKDAKKAMALFTRAQNMGSLSAWNWVFSHTATTTAPTSRPAPPGGSGGGTVFPVRGAGAGGGVGPGVGGGTGRGG